MPQIYDMGPTALLPLRRKACWGFFRPKNPTASAGFELANLGTKGQHATPRPPKPFKILYLHIINRRSFLNREEACLLRGTNWTFKLTFSINSVLQDLNNKLCQLHFTQTAQWIIIVIIIFINCNWAVTRWQCLFYMYTKYEIGYY